ncbi:hypothetical protein Tco_1269536, partial [Tanacetum coccineum]
LDFGRFKSRRHVTGKVAHVIGECISSVNKVNWLMGKLSPWTCRRGKVLPNYTFRWLKMVWSPRRLRGITYRRDFPDNGFSTSCPRHVPNKSTKMSPGKGSNVVVQLAKKLDELMPRMVANVFEDRIPDLLYETLKYILPELIKDSLKQSLQKIDKRKKKTLKATVPNLILRLLNKEFNALNTLESRSCLDNAKHQMQFIQYLEQLVHSQLVELTTEIVRLMDLAPAFNMMAVKGEKESPQQSTPTEDVPSHAQGEQVIIDSINT